jgi:hypothetical protein
MNIIKGEYYNAYILSRPTMAYFCYVLSGLGCYWLSAKFSGLTFA